MSMSEGTVTRRHEAECVTRERQAWSVRHAPNTRAAFAAGRARSAPRPACPRTAAIRSATCRTNAGSFRLPRCGTGARYGASVSTSSRSSGVSRMACVQAPVPEGHHAAERDIVAEVQPRPQEPGPAAERVQDGGTSPGGARSTAATSSSASRAWITTGLPASRGEAELGLEGLALDVARRMVVVVVEAHLARRRPPAGRRSVRAEPVARPRRSSRARRGGGCRRSPRAAAPPRRARARARPTSRDSPITTIVRHPGGPGARQHLGAIGVVRRRRRGGSGCRSAWRTRRCRTASERLRACRPAQGAVGSRAGAAADRPCARGAVAARTAPPGARGPAARASASRSPAGPARRCRSTRTCR